MAEQEMKPAMARKKKHYRFGGRPSPQPKSSLYTSNMAEIKDNIFNVGATSNPEKFTKSLKNIETYIQRTYKMPGNVVKAIQKLKKPTFDPLEKRTRANAWTARETTMPMSTIWPSSRGKKIGSW
jgi:hypothetical protein